MKVRGYGTGLYIFSKWTFLFSSYFFLFISPLVVEYLNMLLTFSQEALLLWESALAPVAEMDDKMQVTSDWAWEQNELNSLWSSVVAYKRT